ncbi:MAG: hypothetical protein ACRYF9_06705 [Janthinobacterium lividum]|uniref:hypothetical protein n=1 Tax=Pseudomonas TaxID=286 RepID=UPI001CFBD78E|nr:MULTISPECIES: hypothetical protein [Pseudomonas]
MNPSNMSVARSSVINGVSMQLLAHWLRRNSHEHQTSGHNLRQQMAARYPVGLLTDDELDALLGAACR